MDRERGMELGGGARRFIVVCATALALMLCACVIAPHTHIPHEGQKDLFSCHLGSK